MIEWGYLIYLTVFRNCQYFGKDEECAYCDINHNYRQQKNGRPYTGVKDIEDIIEVMSWIDKEDSVAKVYNHRRIGINHTQEKNEVDFYLEYPTEIEKTFSKPMDGKLVAQAFEKEDCKNLQTQALSISS